MSNTVDAGSAVLVVTIPNGDSSEAYAVEPGMKIVLKDFSLSDANLEVSGNNLIISVDGKPDILLLDFVRSAQSGVQPTVTMNSGQEISSSELLTALNSYHRLSDIAPAGNGDAVVAKVSGSTINLDGKLDTIATDLKVPEYKSVNPIVIGDSDEYSFDYINTSNYVSSSIGSGVKTQNDNSEVIDVHYGDSELCENGSLVKHEIDSKTQQFPELNGKYTGSDELGVLRNNLVMEGNHDVNVKFLSDGASYKNILGSYVVDKSGNISNVKILSDNTLKLSGDTPAMEVGAIKSGEEIAFFMVSKGSDLNDLSQLSAGKFEFRNAKGDSANINDNQVLSLVHVADSGQEVILKGNAFHSINEMLNADKQIHVISGVNQNGKLQIAFEDMYKLGDADYNDIVIEVNIGQTICKSTKGNNADLNGWLDISTITDMDTEMLSSVKIEIASGFKNGDYLLIDHGFHVNNEGYIVGTELKTEITSDGKLLIRGLDSVDNYEKIINSIQLSNNIGSLQSGARSIDITLFDSAGIPSYLPEISVNVAPESSDQGAKNITVDDVFYNFNVVDTNTDTGNSYYQGTVNSSIDELFASIEAGNLLNDEAF